VVDADLVSHFIYAGEVLSINAIFPHPVKVLDVVMNELRRFPKKRAEVENLLLFRILEEIPFPIQQPELFKEYLLIKKLLFKGDGESAWHGVCSVYKKHNGKQQPERHCPLLYIASGSIPD